MSALFEQAKNIVGGDRRDDYGPLRESFERIAMVWSGILKAHVTTEQVALCMIGVKIVREANKHKDDNVVDLYGYTLCYERLTGQPYTP